MKTIIKRLDRVSIEEFADKHGLTLEVTEIAECEWVAHFKNTAAPGFFKTLIGKERIGRTPEEAIALYVKLIEGKSICKEATPTEHIKVPVLLLG